MKHTYFITGFPGFLAEQLLTQLFKDYPTQIEHVYLLTLPSTKGDAQNQLKYFVKDNDLNLNGFSLIEGDITLPNLDLQSSINKDLDSITHVFHLAAVYDLAVPEELAHQVNVVGTKNVNTWVENLPNLKRYIYFSTAYISGEREGTIYETDLIHNQPFKNHYEETKYIAEISVEALKERIPLTIIRPGVVKGNSITGKTIKFDGLYFLLNVFDKFKYSPIIPMIGNEQVEGNFVPSDYVIKATSFLAVNEVGVNKTYHLTDPDPYLMPEIYTLLLAEFLNRKPEFHIPSSFTKQILGFSSLRKWLNVEQEAIDYFTYDTHFDTTLAQKDLSLSGIKCPDLKDTLPGMIDFYRKYKDDSKMHVKIT